MINQLFFTPLLVLTEIGLFLYNKNRQLFFRKLSQLIGCDSSSYTGLYFRSQQFTQPLI